MELLQGSDDEVLGVPVLDLHHLSPLGLADIVGTVPGGLTGHKLEAGVAEGPDIPVDVDCRRAAMRLRVPTCVGQTGDKERMLTDYVIPKDTSRLQLEPFISNNPLLDYAVICFSLQSFQLR